MSENPEGRAAIETVGAYYEQHLAELLSHVADAVQRFSCGELSALEADGVMFQYSRACQEALVVLLRDQYRRSRTLYRRF